MPDLSDLRTPKRKHPLSARSSTAKVPSLDEDDEVQEASSRPRLRERRGQNEKTHLMAGSLDLPERRMDGKTTYLSSVHCDPLLENSKTAISMTRYGNSPKPLPFTDKFTGDIDSRALEIYYNNYKNPQKSTSSSIPRKSTDGAAKRDDPAQITRTAFKRPSPLTGVNAIRLGPRRLR